MVAVEGATDGSQHCVVGSLAAPALHKKHLTFKFITLNTAQLNSFKLSVPTTPRKLCHGLQEPRPLASEN